MLCPVCNTQAIIASSEIKVTGDTSPDTETQIFRIHTFQCRNPKCSKYQKDIGEISNEIVTKTERVKETI